MTGSGLLCLYSSLEVTGASANFLPKGDHIALAPTILTPCSTLDRFALNIYNPFVSARACKNEIDWALELVGNAKISAPFNTANLELSKKIESIQILIAILPNCVSITGTPKSPTADQCVSHSHKCIFR